MSDWAFYVATTTGQTIGELAGATGRKVTFRLDAPCDAAWTVDGRHPDAMVLGELTTDLFVLWGSRTLGRFRVGASSDTIDADAHTCSFGAVDYRGLLERRYTFAPITYTAQDPAFIAWDLIDYTQTRVALPGGDWGIGRGVHPSFTPINHVVPSGKQIAEGIGDLAKLAAALRAFEWEIGPDLQFNVWTQRGAARDFVAEWGSNVIAVNRAIDPSAYANTVRESGATGVTPFTATVTDLASRPEGRMEAQVGNIDLTTAAAVAATAETELDQFGDLTPTYTMTFGPGRWNPDLLWLGDTATYVIQSGRLNSVGLGRVVEIAVTIGDSGGETVAVTFNRLRQNILRLQRKFASRLEALSRR